MKLLKIKQTGQLYFDGEWISNGHLIVKATNKVTSDRTLNLLIAAKTPFIRTPNSMSIGPDVIVPKMNEMMCEFQEAKAIPLDRTHEGHKIYVPPYWALKLKNDKEKIEVFVNEDYLEVLFSFHYQETLFLIGGQKVFAWSRDGGVTGLVMITEAWKKK